MRSDGCRCGRPHGWASRDPSSLLQIALGAIQDGLDGMREGRWRRLHRPSSTLSHEARRRGKRKAAWLWVLLALVGAAAWADGPAPGWPAFLPPRDAFPADLAAAVERTWIDRTLSRTVRGPSVRAPFDLYSALIDAPDVTAAAARYRSFSRDEVRLVGDD